MISLSDITATAVKSIRKGPLGGLKPKDVEAAIEKAVQDTYKETRNSITAETAKKIDALNTTNGYKLLELKSEIDTFVKKADEAYKKLRDTTNQLNVTNNEFTKATAVKRIEKQLPNGNMQIRSINPKTGTSVQYEVTPKGKKVYHTVTKLDGSTYNTFFNPETGKAQKVNITDIDGNKSVKHFDNNGKISEESLKPKTKVLSKYINQDATETTITETFSDGTEKNIKI